MVNAYSRLFGGKPIEALIIKGKTSFATKKGQLVYLFSSKGCPYVLLQLVSHKIVLNFLISLSPGRSGLHMGGNANVSKRGLCRCGGLVTSACGSQCRHSYIYRSGPGRGAYNSQMSLLSA